MIRLEYTDGKIKNTCKNYSIARKEVGETNPEDRLLKLFDFSSIDETKFTFDTTHKYYVAKPEYLEQMFTLFPLLNISPGLNLTLNSNMCLILKIFILKIISYLISMGSSS